LPALPAVFEATVEATIVNKNYSQLIHEWYAFDAAFLVLLIYWYHHLAIGRTSQTTLVE
jgi:hypothetical protein